MKIELSQHGSPRSRPTPPHGEAGSFGRAAQDEAGTSPLGQQGHLCHQGPHAAHLYATGLEDLTCSLFPTAGFTEDRHTASRPGTQPRRVVASRHLDGLLPTSSAHVARFYKQQIKHGSAALPRGGVFNRGTPTGESTGAHWKGETSQTCIRIRAPRRPRGRQRPLGEALRGAPRPGPQTPPAPPHAAPAVFHRLLCLSPGAKGERGWERKKERLRIGTEASGTFSDPSALTPCSHAGRQRRRPVLPEPRETERGRTRGFRKLLGAAAASPFLSSPRPEAREGREAIGDGSGLVAGCRTAVLKPRGRPSRGEFRSAASTTPRARAAARRPAIGRSETLRRSHPGPGGTPRSSGRRPRAQGRGSRSDLRPGPGPRTARTSRAGARLNPKPEPSPRRTSF